MTSVPALPQPDMLSVRLVLSRQGPAVGRQLVTRMACGWPDSALGKKARAWPQTVTKGRSSLA